jgi:hypothetical protein
MLIPRFWARESGTSTDPKGKLYRFNVWGWSQESSADALTMARQRLSQLVSRIAQGEPPGAYFYGKQPPREEIIRSLGEPGSRTEAVVTRNRYGALVLNTAQVPFIDVDSPRLGAIARFASCRYLESVGSGRPAPESREIVEEHDRVSGALSDLPLA